MKFFIPFFFLFAYSANAQKQLNSQAFQTNVRPILNGLLSDFYQMVSLFPDYPKELNAIVDQIDGLNDDKGPLKEKCPRILDLKCFDTIKSLSQKLSNIDAKILTLLANQKMPQSLHMSTLSGIRILGEVQTKIAIIKGEIDNSSFLMKANLKHHEDTFKIIKSLDEIKTLSSLVIIEYVPFLYKEDFRQFFFNFVHPIQTQLSKNMNYKYFNRNVNSLNFSINLLNVNLTKRNKKTPDGMAPYLAIIHNRWNSILRHYF